MSDRQSTTYQRPRAKVAADQKNTKKSLFLKLLVPLVAFGLLFLPALVKAETLTTSPSVKTKAIYVGTPYKHLPQSKVLFDAVAKYKKAQTSPKAKLQQIGYQPEASEISTLAVLDSVNKAINTIRYVADGKKDTWSDPAAFLKAGGDCEDFAIAKYVALRQLGWSKDNLRILLVKNAKTGNAHAILKVKKGAETLILDSKYNKMLSIEQVGHYAPVAELTEDQLWIHI